MYIGQLDKQHCLYHRDSRFITAFDTCNNAHTYVPKIKIQHLDKSTLIGFDFPFTTKIKNIMEWFSTIGHPYFPQKSMIIFCISTPAMSQQLNSRLREERRRNKGRNKKKLPFNFFLVFLPSFISNNSIQHSSFLPPNSQGNIHLLPTGNTS